MNSREVFPDEELRRRIMDFIMAAGQTLLENGAEVFCGADHGDHGPVIPPAGVP